MSDVEKKSPGAENAEPKDAREALLRLRGQLSEFNVVHRIIDRATENETVSNEELTTRLSAALSKIQEYRAYFESLQEDPQLTDTERGDINEALNIIDEGLDVSSSATLTRAIDRLIESSFEEEEPEPEETPDSVKSNPVAANETPSETAAEKEEDYVFSKDNLLDLKKKGKLASIIESLGARGIGRMLSQAITFSRRFNLAAVFGVSGTSLSAPLMEFMYQSTGLIGADARQAARDAIERSKLKIDLLEGSDDTTAVDQMYLEYKAVNVKQPSLLFADYVSTRTTAFIQKNTKVIGENTTDAKRVSLTIAALAGVNTKTLKFEKPKPTK
ncbi:MAG: hypothetical protein O2904_02235 [bacterium]|nr:hypothetical protein [bacterium]